MKPKAIHYILFTLISSLPYTLAEDPIVSKILNGSWTLPYTSGSIIPSYLIGVAVCFVFPIPRWAESLRNHFFPETAGTEKGAWISDLFYALIFECIFGLTANLCFEFIAPGGSDSLFKVWSDFYRTYPFCILPDLLITHFLIAPSDRLTSLILGEE